MLVVNCGSDPFNKITQCCNKCYFNSILVPGSRLEARDANGTDKWFSVKVQEVDVDGNEVLVHYHNWNSRHDEWIVIDSPRLRIATRTSARHDSGSNQTSNSFSTIEAANESVTSMCGGAGSSILTGLSNKATKDFKSGEKVMAVWKLGRKYPAKIVRLEPDGTFLVEFFDGVECKVKPNNIRRMRREEEDQFKQELPEEEPNSNGMIGMFKSDTM